MSGSFGSYRFGNNQFGAETLLIRTASTFSSTFLVGNDRILSLDRQAAAFAELMIVATEREQQIKTREAQAYSDVLYTRANGEVVTHRLATMVHNPIEASSARTLDFARTATPQMAQIDASAGRVGTLDRTGVMHHSPVQSASGRSLTLQRRKAALEFQNSDDERPGEYVATGSVQNYSSYTFSCWVEPFSVSGSGDQDRYGFTIVGTSDDYSLWLLIRDGEIAYYSYTDSTSGEDVTSGLNLQPFTRYHITVQAELNGRAKIYVDGEKVLDKSTGDSNSWGELSFSTLRPGRGIGFHGTIDNPRLYDRELSEDEVQDLYEGKHVSDGLVGWWSMNEGEGDIVVDHSDNDNHGTLVNDPTWTYSLISTGSYFSPATTSATRSVDLSGRTSISHLTRLDGTAARAATRSRYPETHFDALIGEGSRELDLRALSSVYSDRMFTRAMGTLGLERIAHTLSHPMRADTNRVIDLERYPMTFTDVLQADSERAGIKARASDVFLNPFLTDSERAGIVFSRLSEMYTDQLLADVDRVLTRRRQTSTFLSSFLTSSARSLTLESSASTHLSPVQASTTRDGIVKSRDANVWVEALLAQAARDGVAFDRSSTTLVETIQVDGTDATIVFVRTSNTFAQQLIASSDRKFVHLRDGEFGTARFGEVLFGQGQIQESGKVRGGGVFVTTITAESDRALTARTTAKAFSNALLADADRDLIFNRFTTTWSSRIFNRARGTLGLERYPQTVVDPIRAVASPARDQPRAAVTFLSTILAANEAAHARFPTTFTQTMEATSARELDLRALSSVYSEMILANANRSLRLDRAASTFLQAVAASVGRTVQMDRETVVYVDDIQTLVNRVTERYRDTNVFTNPIWMETDAGAPHWIMNGSQIFNLVEEVRTWDGMVLTFRSPKDILRDRIRPLLDQSGKVDIVERIDGGFDAINRAGEQTEIMTRAPYGREDVRTVDEWYVDDYSEEPRGTGAGQWEVEVELVPVKEKRYDNEFGSIDTPTDLPDSPDMWLFEFDFGDVLTRRVSAEVDRTPEGSIAGAEIEMAFKPREVRTVEESSGMLGATNFREVPDGRDVVEDTSTGNRNTLTISSPEEGEDTVESGDYIVEGFETTWNGAVYTMILEITEL